MNHKLLAALASLLLTACGGPIAPEGEDLSAASEAELKDRVRILKGPARRKATAPAPAEWKVQVAASPTNPIFLSSFPIATTYDVFVAFDIPVALAGQHIAAFEILSPDGAIYQRTEVPFSPGTATAYRVWSSMPVAGTWIQQFAMTGSWTVNVYLDAETAARATRAFILQ